MDRRLPCWESLARACDELFDSLINKYENKFDGEEKIKHFDVIFTNYTCGRGCEDFEELKEKYSNKLQPELIPWIKNELQKNELFKIENWKPYRHPINECDVYIGYRKLFQYKHYVFQLILTYDCYVPYVSPCIYCEKDDNIGHFDLVLHGWKDKNYEKLQPEDMITVLDDNILPESFWSEKA